MIKTYIKEKDKEWKYPILVKHTQLNLIILLTKPKMGMVLYILSPEKVTFTVGDWYGDWVMGKHLIPLVGSLVLENLEEVWFDRNQIDELPFEIGQLSRLQELHLNDNCLTGLPEEFFRLENLVTLDLEKNNLYLPSFEFDCLENLKDLRL